MIYAIVTVLVLILDQAVKYWVNINLAIGENKDFIPGLLQLTCEHNSGAAWGLFQDGRWLFIVLTIVACIVILVALSNDIVKGRLGRWMLVLIMAGGLGNFIDRLIYGYVVDMFEFKFMSFPVFNVADIFISVCGVIFCIWLLFHKSEELESSPAGAEGTPARRTASGDRTGPSDGRAQGHEPQQRGPDYITQLKRPVTQTRAILENERRAAEARASADPFAEFYSTPSASAPQQAAQTQQEQAARPRQAAPAQVRRPQQAEPAQSGAQQQTPAARPRPQQAPAEASPVREQAPESAPKKSSMDFTLEDILAEFSDK